MRARSHQIATPRHRRSPNLSLFKYLKLKNFSPATANPRSILESAIMSSQRKTQSSRANGARSLGPVTVEGKRRSSQNASRHGLLAGQVLLEDEDPEGFEDNITDLVQRFQPADEVEYSFIEEMAVCHWRLRRTWTIEACMLQKQMDLVDLQPGDDGTGRTTDAFQNLAASPALAVIHRYETRMHRMFQRALKNLLLLRTLELPNER